MIFRAPAGHHLLSKPELEKVQQLLITDKQKEVIEYIDFCINEITFYDQIRKNSAQKKMLKEDGELQMASELESDMRERIKHRLEVSKLKKESLINM